MRVGIDIRELEKGKRTGIGRYLRNFIAYASSARPEHRFFLYGNQHTDPEIGGENIEVRIRPEGMTLWWDQVVLPGLANQDRVDLFLSPFIKGPVRVGCPLVVTIHDLMFLVYTEYDSWRSRPKNALFRRMATWVGRRADLIIADSDYSARDIERLLGLDIAKVQVLPIGLDESYRPVEDEAALAEMRRRYGIEGPYIFYLGNFKPHKNVQALLRAFAGLEQELRDEYFLVLGGKPDAWTDERKGLAEELGVGRQVRFIGLVPEEDMPTLYSGAALFVFPSLYEGFGLPPLEAMACGAPVVASNRTSVPEVVGDAGLLVDPEDVEGMSREMEKVLGDAEEQRRLRQLGLTRAAAFRSRDICERQMRILEELAERER
jgi:glycosyltransferase involved in cell wall biosynthesis